jgi:hypothetical protein
MRYGNLRSQWIYRARPITRNDLTLSVKGKFFDTDLSAARIWHVTVIVADEKLACFISISISQFFIHATKLHIPVFPYSPIRSLCFQFFTELLNL